MADTFTVERSTTINAPAADIHARINDFHKWVDWSPWEGIDPNMNRTYTGPTSGVGSGYAWQGSRKVGSGNMSITKSTSDRVEIDLNFLKPFKANNQTVFAFTPDGAGTKVVWTMTGKMNLITKIMGIFMSMDKMVGKDFVKGLAALKTVSETDN